MTLSTSERVKAAAAFIALWITCFISLPMALYEGRATPLYMFLLSFLLFLTGISILCVALWAVSGFTRGRGSLKP